jgi:hypothetical protein
MTQRVRLALLMRVDLDDHPARMTDGGVVDWDGHLWRARDSVLGVPIGFESLEEGVATSLPAGTFTFTPTDATPSSVLNDPGLAGRRVRCWLAEIDVDTGAVTGVPEQLIDWMIDYPEIEVDEDGRTHLLNCVSNLQWLMMRDQGNSLSPSFHERIHPGEKGLRNGSGITTSFAWGAPSPPRGVSSGASLPSRLVRGILGQ